MVDQSSPRPVLRGHRVRMVAGADFKTWIEEHGLEAAAAGVEIQELMMSEGGQVPGPPRKKENVDAEEGFRRVLAGCRGALCFT